MPLVLKLAFSPYSFDCMLSVVMLRDYCHHNVGENISLILFKFLTITYAHGYPKQIKQDVFYILTKQEKFSESS